VIERFFLSAKYEQLYRQEIADGPALADHVGGFLTVYNEARTRRWTSSCRSTATQSRRRSRSRQPSRSAVQLSSSARRTLIDPSAAPGRRVKPTRHTTNSRTVIDRLDATDKRRYPHRTPHSKRANMSQLLDARQWARD
jgi:hypothetical protein